MLRIFGALNRGDLELARNAASNPDPPLELTMALAGQEEPDYHRAALRWIARFYEEETTDGSNQKSSRFLCRDHDDHDGAALLAMG
jgi:hypothetical protein